MTTTRTLEITVGLFVALGIAALLALAWWVSDVNTIGEGNGYHVIAHFDHIGSLKVRSPVTLAGVRIGRVVDIAIDPHTYQAVVTLRIDPRYDQLPSDTGASIYTAGILGEQYISLEPGGMDDFLKEGSRLKITQGALVIEQLIGRFITGKTMGN